MTPLRRDLCADACSALSAPPTARLGDVQARDGTRLLYVTTTPVPSVPRYEWPGDDCANVSACLNPPRFDADVALYNEAALGAIAASGAEVASRWKNAGGTREPLPSSRSA